MAKHLIVGAINGRFKEFKHLLDLKQPDVVYQCGNFWGKNPLSNLDDLKNLPCYLRILGGPDDSVEQLKSLCGELSLRKTMAVWSSSRTILSVESGHMLMLLGADAENCYRRSKAIPNVDCILSSTWDSDVLSKYRPPRWFFAGVGMRRGRTAYTRWVELGELEYSWLFFRGEPC